MIKIKKKIHLKVDPQGNSTFVDMTGAGSGCNSVEIHALQTALGVVDEKSRATNDSAYQEIEPLKLTVHEGE